MNTLFSTLVVCVGTYAADNTDAHVQQLPWSTSDHGKTGSTLRPQQADILQVGRRGMLQGTIRKDGRDETTLVARGTLRVSGACTKQSKLNADFLVRGTTADNKLYYQSEDGASFLYFDKSCDGKGGAPARWIFGSSEPNVTAASDLDGDGKCTFVGSVASGSLLPPKEAVWKLNCATDGWTDVTVSITDITGYAGWHICPEGSFCEGDGCYTDTTDASTPRDRWDQEKVRAAKMEPSLISMY